MSRKSIRIEQIPTNCPEGRILRTEVSYDLGGPNYFSGGSIQRGYHLHTQLYRQNGSFESYSPTDGYRGFIEEAPCFSQKRIQQVADSIKNNPLYESMVQATLNKAGLKKSTAGLPTPTPPKTPEIPAASVPPKPEEPAEPAEAPDTEFSLT